MRQFVGAVMVHTQHGSLYIKWLCIAPQRDVLLSVLARRRAPPARTEGSPQKPSQAFLMLLHWASWRRRALPPSLWETKVYYYTWFALIGLLRLLQASGLKNERSRTCQNPGPCTWINNGEWEPRGCPSPCMYPLLTAVVWKGGGLFMGDK